MSYIQSILLTKETANIVRNRVVYNWSLNEYALVVLWLTLFYLYLCTLTWRTVGVEYQLTGIVYYTIVPTGTGILV